MNATAQRIASPTYVPVTSLQPLLRSALRRVNYNRREIAIQPAATVKLYLPGNDDSRGFALLVRLDTGAMQLHEGDFGGWPQDASRPSVVDTDRNAYPLPPNGVVISGTMGPHGTIATIFVSLAEAAAFLPISTVELTTPERHALYVYRGIISKARPEELRRRRVGPGVVEGLVARGLLKRNAAGAISITVEGLNAIGDWDGWPIPA